MKYAIGFLVGWGFAFGIYGDYARYGQEVWMEVQKCERAVAADCKPVAQVTDHSQISKNERAL